MERNFFESFGSLGDEVSALQLKVEQHLASEIDSSLPFLFRMSSDKETLGNCSFRSKLPHVSSDRCISKLNLADIFP